MEESLREPADCSRTAHKPQHTYSSAAAPQPWSAAPLLPPPALRSAGLACAPRLAQTPLAKMHAALRWVRKKSTAALSHSAGEKRSCTVESGSTIQFLSEASQMASLDALQSEVKANRKVSNEF